MAATLKIISSKVGVGGQRQGVEVRRILQLLSRAGYLKSPASLVIWTDAAIEACKAFHSSIGHGLAEVFDPNALGDPLLTLCKEAKVVLPLASKQIGAPAFLAFWAAAVERGVPYGWSGREGCGEDRVGYGLDGYPDYLVFTKPGSRPEFDPDPKTAGVAMNCISFTNLALSIWRTGGAHGGDYNPSQDAGGFNPISDRYDMPWLSCRRSHFAEYGNFTEFLSQVDLGTRVPTPLQRSSIRTPVKIDPGSQAQRVSDKYFHDSNDVLKVARPGKLYYVQWCFADAVVNSKTGATLAAGFGHHDTVLLDGDIYEINIPKPALQRTPLGARMNQYSARSNAVRLYGPA